MTNKIDRPQPGVKVALKFEQPWEITGDLADCWQLGVLGDNGCVVLEIPVELGGVTHQSVVVEPRYGSGNFTNLDHGQPIVVNQKIETTDRSIFLIGSIRQVRA